MEAKLYEENRFATDSVSCLLHPQTVAAGTVTTIYLGIANYDRWMFIIQGGHASDATVTLDARVLQAQDAAGGGFKAVAGKAITTIAAGAGFATLNQMWLIHVEQPELDVNNFYTHVALEITVTGVDGTWDLGVVCQRETRVFEPAPIASVTELVD